ncbi:MAG: DUF192 domain-containing protein [Kiritimatiellia bacterium]
MKQARLYLEDGILVNRVAVARSFIERTRGLLGKRGLETNRALFIPRCACVHTFFMKFPLDLVFVDRAMRVVKVVRRVPAGRIACGGRGTYGVIEMEAGRLKDELPAEGAGLKLVIEDDGARSDAEL